MLSLSGMLSETTAAVKTQPICYYVANWIRHRMANNPDIPGVTYFQDKNIGAREAHVTTPEMYKGKIWKK